MPPENIDVDQLDPEIKHKGNGHVEEKDMSDILLEHGGERFQIPEGMELDDAERFIRKRREENEQEVNIHEVIHCFPLDGAVALAKVLKKRFGWTNLVPRDMGFFGIQRPTLVGVEISHDDTLQIPWGDMRVPKIEGVLATGFEMANGLPVFCLRGTVKRKDEKKVSVLAKQIRQEVKTSSIYRGKAVKINLRDSDGDRINDFGPEFAPRFIDLTKIKIDEIVYSAETGLQLQVNLFNPIEHTDRCRKNNVPLKRGILLAGPYGTGKTLTADMAALKCAANGWTFIYLEDARDLDVALGFANLYAPCVLFAEDVDKAVPNGTRDVNTDKLFNAMCGVEGKSREVMTILTTNNLTAIHPGFMRPGRIDTVVHVTPPDLGAIVQLVEMYGRDSDGNTLLMASKSDIEESFKGIVGVNAAFIREAVERAKLAAVANQDGDKLKIKGEDLSTAVKTLVPHIKHLHPDLELPGDDFEIEEEEINPTMMALEFLSDQLVGSVLQKIANPGVLEKIVLKKQKKKRRRRGGGGFSFDPSNN